jgi:hypothetical protein
LQSKKGIASVLVAAYAANGIIHTFLDFLRDAAYTAKHVGPVKSVLIDVLSFLTTGPGNLVAIIIAAILILWALQTQPHQAESTDAASPQAKDIEGLKSENETLRRAAEAISDDLSIAKTENERLRNQPDGEGLRRDWLKRECRDMAAYLRWFLKDHGQEPEDQIVDLYRERYQDKVAVLLEQLERQDLYPPEDRKSFQIAADKFPRSPMAIRNLAGTLGSIGQQI